jgi:DNA-binding response OmpR family regulator
VAAAGRSLARHAEEPAVGRPYRSLNSGAGCGDRDHDHLILLSVTVPHRSHRVLAIAGDPEVAGAIVDPLTLEGYVVDAECDGFAGLRRALRDPPDLVVVESALSPIDGLEVCRRLRLLSPVPVVMLVDGVHEADGVAALELGADDYVAKPFPSEVLTARVGAVLRRTTHRGAGALPMRLRAGGIDVDVAAHEAHVGGKTVALSPKEFALLVHFEQVWGLRGGSTSTVTVHVRWLRAKVEPDPSAPRHIRTVWRLGYRFEP